jgi:hypothetical protein
VAEALELIALQTEQLEVLVVEAVHKVFHLMEVKEAQVIRLHQVLAVRASQLLGQVMETLAVVVTPLMELTVLGEVGEQALLV